MRFPALLAAIAFTMTWTDISVAEPATLKLGQRANLALQVTAEDQLGTLDAGYGLPAGQRVPSFDAQTFRGEPTSLQALLADAPLLVVFYRGGWCPYCNVQVRQMSEAAQRFQRQGVTPVLISADRPEGAALAQTGYEIPFPVLSDPDLSAHRAFNVVLTVDESTQQKYRGFGIVLEDWSGRDHGSIAVASAFIVDRNGRILWSHSALDYKTRPSVDQLIAVAKRILGTKTPSKTD